MPIYPVCKRTFDDESNEIQAENDTNAMKMFKRLYRKGADGKNKILASTEPDLDDNTL